VTLNIIAFLVLLLLIGTIIWGIAAIHMLPGRIAKGRGHPQTRAIEITSLCGLIIFPLWMAALIWANLTGEPFGAPAEGPPGEDGGAGDGKAAGSEVGAARES
jgi:hypothetical protein